MLFKPHKYQDKGLSHLINNPACGLFLGMGLGKTVITLSGIEYLINSLEILKPLIVAPKLVTEQTWQAEIDTWDHTKHLKLSRIIGTEQERITALYRKADIYIISRDNINWLVTYLLKQPKKIWPFDMLVLDESSSFKNRESRRFKAVRKVAPNCKRVVLLTGTPAPNSLMDLWSQIFLLDQGERLGRTLTGYRDNYFIKSFNGFSYDMREGVAPIIHDKIKDICISMSAEDYLDLPPMINTIREVHLKDMAGYLKFKKEEVLPLLTGEDIVPLSAAAMYNKLLQFANGAVYDTDHNYHIVDTTKLEMITEDIENLNGESVLVIYQFQSDLDRLKMQFPKARVIKSKKDIDDWNAGLIEIGIGHPASMGHGLNLQHGGSILMWFGVCWSLENYQQVVTRLNRQGQLKGVRNIHYLAPGTIDDLQILRLQGKAETQDDLLKALKVHLT